MSSQYSSPDPSAKPWMTEQEQLRSRTVSELQGQLNEALASVRSLTRELRKEQARHAQTTEAYTKTVTNMVEVARANALLNHELERLKRSARVGSDVALTGLPLELTPNEVKVIRKAMARLHHPDVGGDEQRMKIWNAMLDQLDEAE